MSGEEENFDLISSKDFWVSVDHMNFAFFLKGY